MAPAARMTSLVAVMFPVMDEVSLPITSTPVAVLLEKLILDTKVVTRMSRFSRLLAGS